MDYRPFKIGNKIARFPIVQGGMGIGISLGNLAGTVAKEGGVGTISAAQIGFLEPDFETNPFEANLRAIKKEYEKARRISPDGMIGFNIMVAMRHYKEYVQKAANCGADFIVSGAGLPTELPGYVKDSGVSIAPIVSTDKAAKVILKYWHKKFDRTADFIVIEGPKAGGHLGFSNSQMEVYASRPKYEEEMKAIMETVKCYEEIYGVKIPIVVAGGIHDKSGMQEALALGADAVQVATRFVSTKECDADIRFKQAYVDAQKEDIVIVQSPVGMPGRAILNPFMKQVYRGEKHVPQKCLGCLAKCIPSEIPYCITERLIFAAKGEVEKALLFCGAETYRCKKIETVKEVICSFV